LGLPQNKILVIDDNIKFIESVKTALKNFHIQFTTNLFDAKSKLTTDLDLVLLDLVFDDKYPDRLDGFEFLQYIHTHYPDLKVVIMTNYTSTDITVKSIKAGAVDFFNKKELDWTEWRNRLENYCKTSAKIRELSKRNIELEKKYDDSEIIGISDQSEYVRRRIKDLAQNSKEVSILFTGETGTGKNLAVKYFRKYSLRKDKSFKEFSISELSETVLESELFGHIKGSFTDADKNKMGLFEEADGGILFLDEIGDYDLRIQKKIMRFIEDKTITPVGSTKSKKIDVQLIVATNRDIFNLINEGKFREDLYQRINRIRIDLPPLRNRKEDIKILSDYFFNYFKEKEKTNIAGIEPDVYRDLESYHWPGNIRELQSVIWDACTKARLDKDKILQLKHLRKEILREDNLKESSDNKYQEIEVRKALLELREIEKALEKTNGNKSEAANLLKLNLDSLRYKIKKFIGINDTILNQFPYIKVKYFK